MADSREPPRDESITLVYTRGRDETVSQSVVEAVSTASNRDSDPRRGEEPLPPLFEAVDPDALDQLFEHRRADQSGKCRLTFTYFGYEVTVEDGETVLVTPRSPDQSGIPE